MGSSGSGPSPPQSFTEGVGYLLDPHVQPFYNGWKWLSSKIVAKLCKIKSSLTQSDGWVSGVRTRRLEHQRVGLDVGPERSLPRTAFDDYPESYTLLISRTVSERFGHHHHRAQARHFQTTMIFRPRGAVLSSYYKIVEIVVRENPILTHCVYVGEASGSIAYSRVSGF